MNDNDPRPDVYPETIEQHAPNADELAYVLERIENLHGSDIPQIDLAEAIESTFTMPISVGQVRIEELRVANGNPQHGAMRSDNHISRYLARQPAYCETCETQTTHEITYRAHHYIAGNHAAHCSLCDTATIDEDWG